MRQLHALKGENGAAGVDSKLPGGKEIGQEGNLEVAAGPVIVVAGPQLVVDGIAALKGAGALGRRLDLRQPPIGDPDVLLLKLRAETSLVDVAYGGANLHRNDVAEPLVFAYRPLEIDLGSPEVKPLDLAVQRKTQAKPRPKRGVLGIEVEPRSSLCVVCGDLDGDR